MKLSRVSLVGVLLASVAASCRTSGPASAPVLAIAAASDLRYALEDLTGVFRNAHREISIAVTYGSSGNFYAQLANGAPFDLFLSADVEYPRRLAADGRADPATLFSYAAGRLAIWVKATSSLDIERRGMASLVDDSVARIAIANPEHAPYGRAAEAAMRSAGILEQVRPKLVLGENISQTLQFVQSGAADVGVIALSLARAPQVSGLGRFWIVPADAHPSIEQGGAIMRAAKNAAAAREFRAFMLSGRARAVLQRYGFDTFELRLGPARTK